MDLDDRGQTLHLSVSNIPTEATRGELFSYFTEELGYPVKHVLYPIEPGEAVVILDCSFQDLQIESIIEAGAQLKGHKLILSKTPQVFHNLFVTIDFQMHELMTEEFLQELKAETGVTVTYSETDDQFRILTTWPQIQMVYNMLAQLSKQKVGQESHVSASQIKRRRPHSSGSMHRHRATSEPSAGERLSTHHCTVSSINLNTRLQAEGRSYTSKPASRTPGNKSTTVPTRQYVQSPGRKSQLKTTDTGAVTRSLSLGEVPVSSHIFKETGRDVIHPIGEHPPLSISKVPLTLRGRSHSLGSPRDAKSNTDPLLPESPRLYLKEWKPDPKVSQWLSTNRNKHSAPPSQSHKITTGRFHHVKSRIPVDEERESIRSVPMDFKYQSNASDFGTAQGDVKGRKNRETLQKSLFQPSDHESQSSSTRHSEASQIENQSNRHPGYGVDYATHVTILSDQFSSLPSDFTQRFDMEVTSIVSDQMSSNTDNTRESSPIESSDESTIHTVSTIEDMSAGPTPSDGNREKESPLFVEKITTSEFEINSSSEPSEAQTHNKETSQRRDQQLPKSCFKTEGEPSLSSVKERPQMSRRIAATFGQQQGTAQVNRATMKNTSMETVPGQKDTPKTKSQETNQNTLRKEMVVHRNKQESQEFDIPNIEGVEPVMMERDLWDFVQYLHSEKLDQIKNANDVEFDIEDVAEFLQFRVVPNQSSTTRKAQRAMEEISCLYQKCFSICVKEEIEIPKTVDGKKLKKTVEDLRMKYPKTLIKEINGGLHIVGGRSDVFLAKHRLYEAVGMKAGRHRDPMPQRLSQERNETEHGDGRASEKNRGHTSNQEVDGAAITHEADQLDTDLSMREEMTGVPKAPKEHYITYQGLHLLVYEGDIIQECVSVIVSAGNSQLMNGGGVAGAISRAAGPGLEMECSEFIEEYGSLPMGHVMHTTAGGTLKCDFVIHAVGPVWDINHEQECEDDLMMTFLKCFRYASEKLKAKTMATPLISSGIFGMPLDICTRALMHAIDTYSRQYGLEGPLTEIHVVNLDTEGTLSIQNTFSQYFNNIRDVSQNMIDNYPKEGSSVDPCIEPKPEYKGGQNVRGDETGRSKYELIDAQFDAMAQDLASSGQLLHSKHHQAFHRESKLAGGERAVRRTDKKKSSTCGYCHKEMDIEFKKECGHHLCLGCYNTFSSHVGCPVCVKH
ncbi:uncharacterized protein LOC106156578 [Lingula anatina]|uniref:Uncharacterized protein LOC106156578 n=1 Tax=Lingula anatina TaxID=7574 RepID=A0A1S3HP83_LINAN|nr:uncharacterized protein LOC106156578 [Lingula anatina]|eukprot:XP_013387351.1 uncharacterized protein LOC106156578 [Lingula anatina]